MATKAAQGLVVLLAGLASTALPGCGRQPDLTNTAILGNPEQGALIVARESCGSCHAIPGIPLADGTVGPPLTHFARHTTIAGLLPNTPDNLARWVRVPQSVVPGNAMPNMGLSEEQSRDVAAYLQTLR